MGGISVLVADGQRLLADALAVALRSQPDLVPVPAVATSGGEAVDLAARVRPDVVVVDFWMAGHLNGVEATAQIRERSPGTEVLVLSALPGAPQVQASLAAGAAGYLPKTVGLVTLADAVRRAHRGDSSVFGEQVWRLVERIDERAAQAGEIDARLATLTPREWEVVSLLPAGRPGRDLAAALAVSEGTLRNYLHAILRKTGAANQQELLRLVRNGTPAVTGMPSAAAAWQPTPEPDPAIDAGRHEVATVTVVLADELRLFAEALGTALHGARGVTVAAAHSGNGTDALAAVVRTSPPVVVYDQWMPPATGAAVARYFRRWLPQTAVVLTSWLHGPRQVAEAASAGAAGLVSKGTGLDDVVETLLDAAAGRPLVHAAPLPRDWDHRLPPPPDGWDPVASLTPRELEVLQWLGQGASFPQVARHLGISAGTVKNHVSSALARTGTRSRTEAIEMVRQAGLVREPGAPPP